MCAGVCGLEDSLTIPASRDLSSPAGGWVAYHFASLCKWYECCSLQKVMKNNYWADNYLENQSQTENKGCGWL